MGWYLTRQGRVYCPLCGLEVPPDEQPDTSLPPRLRLSGNHRLHLGAEEFERMMRDISDADLAAALGGGPGALAVLGAGAPDPRLYTCHGLPGEHFLSVSEYRAAVRARPGLEEEVIRQAEETERHRLGYGAFAHDFGPVVDFNHDFGVPGLKYGFHYWQWAGCLIGAHALTSDERWAASLAELFRQWYAQRDRVSDALPGVDADVIWYELGLAVRLPYLIDALRLTGAPQVRREGLSDLVRAILGQIRWLHRCSTANPYHAYNWPIQTAVTLAYAGWALGAFREAPAWREQGRAVVAEHVERDFQADGGYQERTPGYTAYVLDLLDIYDKLVERLATPMDTRDSPVRTRIRSVTEGCLDLWARLANPAGQPPAVNDTRRVNPLGERLARRPAPHGPGGSVMCRETGFAVMRADTSWLFVNFAPWAVHTHEDFLSFECFAGGAALAVDPAIAEGGYGAPEHEGWYRAARAHNMLCVNEADPLRHETRGEEVVWSSGPEVDFLGITHRGYEEPFGVVHRRQIAFVRPHYWLVVDRVWTRRVGLDIDWFLHSPLRLRQVAAGWVSTGGPGLSVVTADAGRTARRQGSGPADLGGLPGETGTRRIDWLSFRWSTRGEPGPEEIAVVVAPGLGEAVCTRLPGGAESTRYRVEGSGYRHVVEVAPDGARLLEVS